MTKLPKSRGSCKPFHSMLNGAIGAELLVSAVEMGIFDHLQEFRTADEVAARTVMHPGNLGFYLDALATVDLLEKRNGAYRNLPMTQEYLTSGSDLYMGPLLRLIKRKHVDVLGDVRHLLDKNFDARTTGHKLDCEASWADMARTSSTWALGEVGEMVQRIVSELPGFDGFDKMLDLGGGPGILGLYIVEAHPTMRGIVFDQPAVVEVAKENIARYGMEGRMTVMGGDYMRDALGEGYDLIWASATLNFAKFDIDRLVGKVYDALKPGGYFLSFQDGLTHEKTKPDTMLGHLVDMLRMGVDFSLEQGFVAEAMVRNGFRSVRSRTVETPMAHLDLDIARK